MRKFLSSIFLLFLMVAANGQTFLSDQVSGKPYIAEVYDQVRGKAFLFDDWKSSTVTDVNGNEFLDVMVKFDVYANKFLYSHGDTAYEFITIIEEVKMFQQPGDTTTQIVFKKGFSIPGKLSPDKFVQILAEGKATAIKYLGKWLQEVTEYNVPGKTKVFMDKTTYFFIKEDKIISQKPNQKLVEELLKDKWAILETYMKQNSFNLKKEDDCLRLIRYYNIL